LRTNRFINLILDLFAGLVGRFVFFWLSEAIGWRPSGILLSFGAAIGMVLAGRYYDAMIGSVSVFWLMVILSRFCGHAVVGPYAAEVWPAGLRASGMGFGYGLGNLGKVFGPAGLALIAGSPNLVNPKASLTALEPAMWYLAGWCALAGLTFLFLGFETKVRSLEEIDDALSAPAATEMKRLAG
jgi:putative MFS transporter